MSSDDVLNFITQDVKKERSPLWRPLLYVALFAPFAYFLYEKGIRPMGADTMSGAMMVAFFAVLLLPIIVFPLIAKKGGMKSFWVLLGSVLVGSVASIFFSFPGRHESEFTAEILSLVNQQCFNAGVLLGGLMSLLVQGIMSFTAPTVGAAWRIGAAMMGGVAGFVTLFMYCAVVGINHMFYGHFTQFVLVSAISIGLSQFLFTLKMKKLLPSKHIKNKGSLG